MFERRPTGEEARPGHEQGTEAGGAGAAEDWAGGREVTGRPVQEETGNGAPGPPEAAVSM